MSEWRWPPEILEEMTTRPRQGWTMYFVEGLTIIVLLAVFGFLFWVAAVAMGVA